DAINATAVHAGADVEVLEDLRRQEGGALDQLAVHVEDVQCAVGGIGKLHRTEPVVAGGEELDVLVGALSREGNATRFQASAVDQIAGHLADEDVAAVLLGPGVTAIGSHAGGAGEEPGRLSALVRAGYLALGTEPRAEDAPGLVGTDAKQFRVLAGGRDVDGSRRRLHVGVARQVTAVVQEHVNGVAVLADEGAAPVVHAHAVLAAAAGHLERHPPWVEEETLTTNGDGLRVLLVGPANVTAGNAGGDVKAVIQSPAERVEHPFAGSVAGEAGEDRLAHVRFPVTFAILVVDDIRHRADEDAAIVT